MIGRGGGKSVPTGAPSDRCLRSRNIQAAAAAAGLSLVHDQQNGVYIYIDMVNFCEALPSTMDRSTPPNQRKTIDGYEHGAERMEGVSSIRRDFFTPGL